MTSSLQVVILCWCTILLNLCQPGSSRCTSPPDMGCGFATGSVLFQGKKCWEHDDLVLLSTRRTFQNLIPTNKLDTNNDDYVPVLMEYFRMCFSKAQEIAADSSLVTMQLALADTVGGYLHYYAIPITLYGFYAGTVRYDYAQTLMTFYTDLKAHLDTNGDYWARPIDASKIAPDVKPMYVPSPRDDQDPCSLLNMNEQPRGSRFTTGENGVIPLPYLDNNVNPSAMAVPMGASKMSKLSCSRSANVLEKYYVTSIQCLRAKAVCTDTVVKFKRDLSKWLNKQVVPHLKEEQLYPAFGGVLRILETVKQSSPDGIGKPDSYFMGAGSFAGGVRFWKRKWLLLAGLFVCLSVVWLCAFVLCLCLRRHKNNSYKILNSVPNKDDDSSYQFINAFVQVFYNFKESCYGSCIVGNEADNGYLLQNADDCKCDIAEDPNTSNDLSKQRRSSNKNGNKVNEDNRAGSPDLLKRIYPLTTSKTQSAPLPNSSGLQTQKQYSVHHIHMQSPNPLRGSLYDDSDISSSDCESNGTTSDEDKSMRVLLSH